MPLLAASRIRCLQDVRRQRQPRSLSLRPMVLEGAVLVAASLSTRVMVVTVVGVVVTAAAVN